MSALDVLRTLHALGVTLTPQPDGTLSYDAPQGTMTEYLIASIREQKAALLDLVEEYGERAAIAEYCGGLSRAEAEALAWEVYATKPPRPCCPHNPMKMADGWRCTRCNTCMPFPMKTREDNHE